MSREEKERKKSESPCGRSIRFLSLFFLFLRKRKKSRAQYDGDVPGSSSLEEKKKKEKSCPSTSQRRSTFLSFFSLWREKKTLWTRPRCPKCISFILGPISEIMKEMSQKLGETPWKLELCFQGYVFLLFSVVSGTGRIVSTLVFMLFSLSKWKGENMKTQVGGYW